MDCPHLRQMRHKIRMPTGSAVDATYSYMAWQVAGAAFIVGFVVFGVTYSFGTFLLPLTLEFRISQASGSAFFAASGAGFYLLGPLTGYLGDKFGPRITTAIGAILISGGLV